MGTTMRAADRNFRRKAAISGYAVLGAILILLIQPSEAGAVEVPRPDLSKTKAGARSMRLSGEAHLESVAYRIGTLKQGDRRKVDLGTLDLRVGSGGDSLPGAALAPENAEPSLAGRISTFFSGVLSWVGGHLKTDHATAGADIQLDRKTVVGATLGLARDPSTAETGLRANTGAAYVLRQEGDVALHLTVGGGRGRIEEGVAGRTVFAEAGASWRRDLGGFAVTPAVRLGMVQGSARDKRGRRQKALLVTALAGLRAERGWRFEQGDLNLVAEVLYRTPLADGSERRRRDLDLTEQTPLDRGTVQRSRAVLRLGTEFYHRDGTQFSLDHVTEPDGRGGGDSRVRAGMKFSF
ncbi:MAG TPA: autotransporter domain-containing protein [Azospirillaceae bacterium]|nr:autotransporter domain-containing protein [Azospirillaceae bacterium]